jgi:hypothetical protein
MIIWDQEDLTDPKNDLCSIYNGKYVDIVQDFNNTWWPMYDHDRVYQPIDPYDRLGLPTREDAIKFLENFLAEKG